MPTGLGGHDLAVANHDRLGDKWRLRGTVCHGAIKVESVSVTGTFDTAVFHDDSTSEVGAFRVEARVWATVYTRV